MIGIWVMVILIAIAGIAIAVACGIECMTAGGKIAGVIVSLLVAALICGGLLWYLYGTEPGKRLQKTFHSETSGGIERIVTVYDVNGEIIAEYNGKFDVTYDDCRVLFDDEDGLRHVIYYTTGTVIIDEIGTDEE